MICSLLTYTATLQPLDRLVTPISAFLQLLKRLSPMIDMTWRRGLSRDNWLMQNNIKIIKTLRITEISKYNQSLLPNTKRPPLIINTASSF